jgi:hypothetical protein
VEKEPWMRSFCSRELTRRVSYFTLGVLIPSGCNFLSGRGMEYIVGGLGSHTIRSTLWLVY